MWLAETAADTESLELLAQHGIKFTVLAPHQCRRIRSLKDGGSWTETPNASVDTTHPYLVRFNSGVSIAIFFYDGPASRAIAFEGLLNSGESFAARLKGGFKDNAQPQLVHVATDGESYGHHHKYGEMALAYALRCWKDRNVKLTNYGCFLSQFPPEYEAEIVDNTSWSCVHGVERWRSNCGCNGGKQGWNQAGARPLRQALDELRDAMIPLTDQEGGKLFKRCLGSSRRLHPCGARPRSGDAGAVLCRESEPRAYRDGARARS
jgi:alpha-amylase/alpha-mannosidase (GH57 family)